ncbi:vitamin B12 dependent-methionine synthase activation domain-containing protein [Lacrimispora saccharolytica]|uniref:Vitamin B12 dependent methionine synthase activation region n=1 Tax=Lacrimispora saccharolytica (strain ATCC 35040 / DSM 2544 / NRCC 2533 / WM1) TaxID=610130 RepID=D9R4F2_LACSW|nr:vitamin B12 dependent-methionine synthase activation domain-containing protein [Lacrimispora saccharolytica]ADL05022.1 Vitamin B12 dependent methionine synthase activation region [[Clostridium] saccharolyticum WM1]QRV20779.1 Vitamin B12 dependent methionine synthase activation subunit [Lacrimispora saccharolytica]
MEISRKEIRRYLGYGKNEGDEAVNALIEECIRELMACATPKSITRVYPLELLSDDWINFTVFKTKSRNLSRNLADCEQVILFAATLGSGVDVLLHKYTKLQMSKAVVMQAAAAAMIEEYCDEENRKLKEEYEDRKLYLRPRFSPGYGDFPLVCQKDITAVLETSKRIGITLTDSLLMIPSKSVTAVMGVSGKPYRCEIQGCESCSKTDCAYRRN